MKRINFIERTVMGALSFLQESVFADEYAQAKGFLQARDPRIKVPSVLLLLLAVLFSGDIAVIAGIYALCILLAALSSIRLGFFLKRTWIFIPFFSLCIALPALFDIFSPGQALFSFPVLSFTMTVTRQGVLSAGIFFLRVLTSVSLGTLLVLTTRHYSLLKVLRMFRVPQVFVMTLGMCYRYIYLFIEIIQNTYLAIKSRVGRVPSSRSGRGLVAWNIASLWQRSFALHSDVYNAMLSRGYTGEPKILDEFRAGPKDWFWLGGAAFVFGLTIWRSYCLS